MPERKDSLLSGLLAGGEEAVAQLYGLIAPVVAAKAYSWSAADREDIVQEAIVHVIQVVRRPDFEITKDFRSLVRTIAMRRCLDRLRRRRKTVTASFEEMKGSETADGPLMAKERRTLLAQVLARLRPPCRELIRLRIVERLEYSEIAAIQGKSTDAVRRMWCDCLKEATRIRQHLERFGARREGRSA